MDGIVQRIRALRDCHGRLPVLDRVRDRWLIQPSVDVREMIRLGAVDLDADLVHVDGFGCRPVFSIKEARWMIVTSESAAKGIRKGEFTVGVTDEYRKQRDQEEAEARQKLDEIGPTRSPAEAAKLAVK